MAVVPLYNVNFFVSVGATMREAVLALPRQFSIAVDQLSGDFSGTGMQLRDDHGNFAICFRSDKLDRDAIAHEIDHTQYDIWRWIDEDMPGKECRGYLVGWLTKEVCAILGRNGVPILD